METYEARLAENAKKLDQLTKNNSHLHDSILDLLKNKGNIDLVSLLKQLSDISSRYPFSYGTKNLVTIIKKDIVNYYGYLKIHEVCNNYIPENSDNRTLEELLSDLNDLIGLSKVKNIVNDLIAYQRVQKLRESKGLHTVKSTLHMAFLGNPGTGKTTVARIVGHIYKQLGLLSKGHFTEVSRTDLIAGYQGQTALKVKKVIEKAKGGVLFIDEAYSITENEYSDSYGRECLTELTKALEDYRNDLVVIVAGYTELMKTFFESNPGLKSRFNTFIEFDDYNAGELQEILLKLCRDNDYVLNPDVLANLLKYLEEQVSAKEEYFANGRFIRNLYDDLVMNYARRVSKSSDVTKEMLQIITNEDAAPIIKTNL